jgi:hypothetical protein
MCHVTSEAAAGTETFFGAALFRRRAVVGTSQLGQRHTEIVVDGGVRTEMQRLLELPDRQTRFVPGEEHFAQVGVGIGHCRASP